MPEKKFKVGIAGYGVVGKRRRQYIDLHPSLATVAVCDKSFEQAKTLTDGVKAFSNYEDLLREELDILFVCMPNYIAAEVTMAGLKNNLHVFCEKPPGRDVKDIENVIAVEKSHPDLVLKYGFNHRYHDSVQEALKLIQSGKMGKIINMRGVYGKSKVIPFSGGWRAERKYSGGGILLDQGIHLLDLMRLFCGNFVDVKSFISNDFWKHDVEDNAYALLRDGEGRVAMLHSSATQWQHRFSLDISLTEGFIGLRGILSGSKSYGEEELIIGPRDESDLGTTREQSIKYLQDKSWELEINEFADAVEKKKPIQHGKSSEALETMKLVYKIYGSDLGWKKTHNIPDID